MLESGLRYDAENKIFGCCRENLDSINVREFLEYLRNYQLLNSNSAVRSRLPDWFVRRSETVNCEATDLEQRREIARLNCEIRLGRIVTNCVLLLRTERKQEKRVSGYRIYRQGLDWRTSRLREKEATNYTEILANSYSWKS